MPIPTAPANPTPIQASHQASRPVDDRPDCRDGAQGDHAPTGSPARGLWDRVADACRRADPQDELALAARWDDAGGAVLLGRPDARIDRSLGELGAGHLLPDAALPGASRGASDASVWIGAVAYDAARCVEPALAAGRPAASPRVGAPGVAWRRVPNPEVFRAEPGAIPDAPAPSAGPGGRGYVLEVPCSVADAGAYRERVRRVLRYIRAGDVYQVNLAHRLTARLTAVNGRPGPGAPRWSAARAFAADLLASSCPRHGVYLEGRHPDGRRWALCSASPERFLRWDRRTGVVRTTPMKGTRPLGTPPDERVRAELEGCEKDRAELAMIVDLMRNDLGRVCRPGTLRVDAGRRVESHGGSVWQAVAEVSGVLRDGLGAADLLAATLAPGSVTGAPKIRAMQIIDELEGVPSGDAAGPALMPGGRGWYCGAAGWLDASGLGLNVMIRTATITETPDGSMEVAFPVGAGLVADSDPEAEWRETLVKSGVLARLAGAPGDRR